MSLPPKKDSSAREYCHDILMQTCSGTKKSLYWIATKDIRESADYIFDPYDASKNSMATYTWQVLYEELTGL